MIAGWPGQDGTAEAIRQALDYDWRPAPWTADASCASLTSSEADRLFFVDGGQAPLEAQAMCAGCPVAAQCRAAGEGEAGYWAGTSERDRAGTSAAVRRNSAAA